jgi:YfiR/HmsC-like
MKGAKAHLLQIVLRVAGCGMISVMGGLLLSGCAGFHVRPSTECREQAMLLFRFGQFVEWPASVLPASKTPIVIGVLGGDPFGNELETISKDRTINGHPLVVQSVTPSSDLQSCQILFINRSAKFSLPIIFNALKNSHTLTVSDMDGFFDAGGMIQFVREGGEVRFEINQTAAKKAGLKISSQMLEMAERLK